MIASTFERTWAVETFGAEARCRAFIEEYAKRGQQPPIKDDLWEEASDVIGPQLNREAFNRAWRNAAPDSWKKQGRKKAESFD